MFQIFHRGPAKIQADRIGVRIVIPYWFGWPSFAFMIAWTTFSASAAYSNPTLSLFGLFWVLGLVVLLWLRFGRETVSFDESEIVVRRGLFGIGPVAHFPFADVRDIRVGSHLDSRAPGGKWDPSFVHAGIYFEYRGKTQSFGNEILETEAARIVHAIQNLYPQLVYSSQEAPERELPDTRPKRYVPSYSATKTRPNPILPLIFGLFILWGFGVDTVGRRLNIELEGVVTSSRDIPITRGPRYATEYTLRGTDGLDHVYVAGPTDASLPRSMPVGTYLRKVRWHLYYERNGQRVDDFPLFFYEATLTIAFCCLVWSFLLWQGSRRRPGVRGHLRPETG